MTEQANDGSVTDLFTTTDRFAELLNEYDGEEIAAEAMTRLAATLCDTARAQLLLQLLRSSGNPDLSFEEKRFAVTLAETFGPDHCQWLYRFAVLCTKVV